MLENKSILITGGTGSFGNKFIEILLEKYPQIKRIVVFSRDELKQFEMAQKFSNYSKIDFILGDIREKEGIKKAFFDVDIVIHAAALKQVPASEKNPFEFIKTNILGTQNIIETAIESNVKNVIALSTDKAASPSSLYGATKMCMEKLLIAAHHTYHQKVNFSVVRQGNFMISRGSVIPLFLEKKEQGIIPITDEKMTRFNMLWEDSIEMVFFALQNSIGGEIFVPKIPSYKITDLAKAIAPEAKIEIIGKRAGEKLHEQMITEIETDFTIETEKYYIIVPELKKYMQYYKGKKVNEDFIYSSEKNSQWLSVDDIKNLIF
jgi:UDP-N-acetylglucosamine 4,6-dehydratase (inverting)